MTTSTPAVSSSNMPGDELPPAELSLAACGKAPLPVGVGLLSAVTAVGDVVLVGVAVSVAMISVGVGDDVAVGEATG